jgi:hypothetical protein
VARHRLAALVAAVLLTGCGEPAQESNPFCNCRSV